MNKYVLPTVITLSCVLSLVLISIPGAHTEQVLLIIRGVLLVVLVTSSALFFVALGKKWVPEK